MWINIRIFYYKNMNKKIKKFSFKGIIFALVFISGFTLGRQSLNDKSENKKTKQEYSKTVNNEQVDLIDTVEIETKEEMVWVSKTGKCYHKINNCGNMDPKNAHKVGKNEAEDVGLKKCSKCW